SAGLRVFAPVSILAASLFSIITIRESLMAWGVRPGGPFPNENLYADYLAFNVFLSVMLARLDERDGNPPGLRVPLWLTTPLLLVGILATGSRGAILGAALAFPVLLRWRRPASGSWRRLIPALGALGLAAFAWLFGLAIRDAVVLGRGPAAAVAKPALAIILAVLGQSLVSNGEHYRSLWIALGMLAAVYEAAGRGEGG